MSKGSTSVTIKAAPFLPGIEDLTLSASSEKNALPTTASVRGVPAWVKGQALRLSENKYNSTDWCTNCNMSIMVDVVEPGRYYIIAKSD